MSSLSLSPVGPEVPSHREVLFHGEMLEDASSLDDLKDAFLGNTFRRHLVDLLSHELNTAVGDFAFLMIEQA